MAKSAAVLIIGNEILSGWIQDTNLKYLATNLLMSGIVTREGRIVGDRVDEIALHVNELRKKYDYLFTTGGIGPTHDDVTAEAISEALSLPLVKSDEAEQVLLKHYRQIDSSTTMEILRTAKIPFGASLISNPISFAPGFFVSNVYAMAGVPIIMMAMLRLVLNDLEAYQAPTTKVIHSLLPEDRIARGLREVQISFPNVSIGSYPKWDQLREQGVMITLSGYNLIELDKAFECVKNFLKL